MKSLSPVHLLERFLLRKSKSDDRSSTDRNLQLNSNRAASASMQMSDMCDDADEDMAMSLGTEEEDGSHATMSFSDIDRSASALIPPKILTDDDKLMKLVSIQSFDGAFKMDMALAQLLDTTLEDIKKGNFN